jgi:hypothetical protein
MNKKEFQEMIQKEVISIVRTELPKMIRPMVQEAVAGALANLLAEGIVKGPPKMARPDVPQARTIAAQPNRSSLDEGARRRLMSQYMEPMDQIGAPERPAFTSDSLVNNILSETALQMQEDGGYNVPSVLDSPAALAEISPEMVGAISRDYSEFLKKIDEKKRNR